MADPETKAMLYAILLAAIQGKTVAERDEIAERMLSTAELYKQHDAAPDREFASQIEAVVRWLHSPFAETWFTLP